MALTLGYPEPSLGERLGSLVPLLAQLYPPQDPSGLVLTPLPAGSSHSVDGTPTPELDVLLASLIPRLSTGTPTTPTGSVTPFPPLHPLTPSGMQRAVALAALTTSRAGAAASSTAARAELRSSGLFELVNDMLVFATSLSDGPPDTLALADFVVFRMIINAEPTASGAPAPALTAVVASLIDPRKYRFLARYMKYMKQLGVPLLPDQPGTTAVPESSATNNPTDAEIAIDGGWNDVIRLVKSQGNFDESMPGLLPNSVVTRFPPEPSGYLHIGHVKAALLNDFYARNYGGGKLILRFDDTNPLKEKVEFETNIRRDLDTLGIRPDKVEYTSDYFDVLLEVATKMVAADTAYVDCSPPEVMKDERMNKISNTYRAQSVEENMRMWAEMKAGSEEGKKGVLRAKLDITSPNGCMRDPTMYRFVLDQPHHRTGNKFILYPLYDFACPIVDSLEGVTHTMRSAEYADREEQYYWFLEVNAMRKPFVSTFSRLNMAYTLMSKRKLAWFVEQGLVEGWSDPRFPTIQGIRRRGLTVQALRAFILAQGASKHAGVMEWDKIWTVNKRVIDPIAPRFTAISSSKQARLRIANIEPADKECARHKKNPAVGTKIVAVGKEVILEESDASTIADGEIVTLMDLGNVKVSGRTDEILEGEFLPNDSNFKKTKKLTWLAVDGTNADQLVPVTLVRYKHLINKVKVEEDDKIEDLVNENSKIEESTVADRNVASLSVGDFLQFERRGYFICDSLAPVVTMIEVPDGRTKSDSMS